MLCGPLVENLDRGVEYAMVQTESVCGKSKACWQKCKNKVERHFTNKKEKCKRITEVQIFRALRKNTIDKIFEFSTLVHTKQACVFRDCF